MDRWPIILGTPRYSAIPLSDGHHVLFADPETNHLCLGHETTLGRFAHLSRRYHFLPPPGVSSTRPLLHVVGTDLKYGARVVATFELKKGQERDEDEQNRSSSQVLVLYTVPPDALQALDDGLSQADINDHLHWTRW
jgi:hypothetical protein